MALMKGGAPKMKTVAPKGAATGKSKVISSSTPTFLSKPGKTGQPVVKGGTVKPC